MCELIAVLKLPVRETDCGGLRVIYSSGEKSTCLRLVKLLSERTCLGSLIYATVVRKGDIRAQD